MNRNFILALSLVFCIVNSSYSQDDNVYWAGNATSVIPEPLALPDFPKVDGEIMYQQVFDFEADKTKLYGVALKYVSDYYKSAKAVTDVSDPASGLIIVKGNFDYASDFYYQFFGTNKIETVYTTGHTLKIEVKDKKMRVSINNLHMFSSILSTNSDKPVTRLISEYKEYEELKKPKKREKLEQVNRSELLKDMDIYARAFLLELPAYFEKQLQDDW